MAKNTPQSHLPQALDCPACGAALPAGQGRVECSYCGTIVQIDRPAPQEARPQPGQPSSGVTYRSPTITIVQSRKQPARRRSCGFTMLLLLMVILAAGVAGLYGYQRATGSTWTPAKLFQPRLYASTNMLVLTPDRALPQILMRVNGGEENANRLVLLDLATKDRVWVGPALTKEASSGRLAASADTIVFSDERTLLGFSRTDGSQRWSAQLSDTVCDGCLVIANGAAVALTADFVVQGFDLQTGERLWSYDELGGYALRRLQVIGDNILVYGRDQEVNGQVNLLDGATGQLVSQFVPYCAANNEESGTYTDPDDAQWLSPDGQTLVIVSDSWPACVHAYDLATGQRRWQSTLEPYDSGFLLHKDMLASGTELFIGGASHIYAIQIEDGTTRDVTSHPDYAFLPLTVRDGVIYSIAIKQRGSRLIELWGVDAQNGKQLWKHAFKGDGELFEPPYDAAGTISGDEEVWGWAETSAGFTLLTLQAKPHQYTLELLDARTGQAISTKMIEQPDERTVWVPDQAARQGSLIYLISSAKLQVLDLEQGTLAYEGP